MVAPIVNAREGDRNLPIYVELLPDASLVPKYEVVAAEEDKRNKRKKKVVPEKVEWSGLATNLDARCDQGSVCEKFVAFADVDSGRRFLASSHKVMAEKEHAIGQVGNTQLAMMDLKEDLEKKKMADKSSTNIHQVFRAKAEKERSQAMKEMDQAMQERDNLVEERDHLKKEKRRLEYMIGDLLKHKEETKDKIRKLKGILDVID
ncbi:secologanin synthase [Hordeum vulgare]|nr:secologanin synthase [Hordeum vulgare]